MSKAIERALREYNISQAALAAHLEVSGGYLSRVKSGAVVASQNLCRKLAELLDERPVDVMVEYGLLEEADVEEEAWVREVRAATKVLPKIKALELLATLRALTQVSVQ